MFGAGQRDDCKNYWVGCMVSNLKQPKTSSGDPRMNAFVILIDQILNIYIWTLLAYIVVGWLIAFASSTHGSQLYEWPFLFLAGYMNHFKPYPGLHARSGWN